jgi:hypothetical protein
MFARLCNVRFHSIANIRDEPKAYADIPLLVVREPPLNGCYGWKRTHG